MRTDVTGVRSHRIETFVLIMLMTEAAGEYLLQTSMTPGRRNTQI